MNSQDFRDIVSGKQRGLGPDCLRTGLRLLEIPYATVTSVRNMLYDRGLLRQRDFPIPIVSVGNLTLGGTGKSPFVAWLGQFFLEQGRWPGLISRGYGRGSSDVNDEYLELAFRLPRVPHKLNPNRLVAATEFLNERDSLPVDVLHIQRPAAEGHGVGEYPPVLAVLRL